MPDNILLIVFGILSALGLAVGITGFWLALKNSKKPEGEIKMAGWAVLGLAGLVLAGMSWAYFLLPILWNHLFGK
jgi:hypothetical protein